MISSVHFFPALSITLTPQPKATSKHDPSTASPCFLYAGLATAGGVLRPVPCVFLASPDSWCLYSVALTRDGTCSKPHFVHSKFYIPEASGKVCHPDFDIGQSVNKKIAILIKAQRTDLSATLELYYSISPVSNIMYVLDSHLLLDDTEHIFFKVHTSNSARRHIYQTNSCNQGCLRRGGLTPTLAPRMPVITEDVLQ